MRDSVRINLNFFVNNLLIILMGRGLKAGSIAPYYYKNSIFSGSFIYLNPKILLIPSKVTFVATIFAYQQLLPLAEPVLFNCWLAVIANHVATLLGYTKLVNLEFKITHHLIIMAVVMCLSIKVSSSFNTLKTSRLDLPHTCFLDHPKITKWSPEILLS